MQIPRRELLLNLGALSVVGIGGQTSASDRSSPKDTIVAFVNAIVEKDRAGMVACVKEGNPNGLAAALMPEVAQSINIVDMIADVEGNRAKVAVHYTIILSENPKLNPSTTDMLHLERDGSQWQIVSPLDEGNPVLLRPDNTWYYLHPVRSLVIMTGPNAQITRPIADRNREGAALCSLGNMKQLALGLCIYAQDHQGFLPTPADDFKELIFPYIKNDAVFQSPHAPMNDNISYCFNPLMAGVNVDSVQSPDRVVLLFESSNSRPVFRWDGRTAVAFANFHGKLVTKEQLTQYRWKPF